MKYRPEDGFPYYYNLAAQDTVQTLFASRSTVEMLQSIDEKKGKYRYATDKWTIKQLIGHITDHERIKMFRAFQLSRKENVELWGYDQNFLVNNARFDALTLKQLITDFSAVRTASLSFIATLSERQLNIQGKARQYQITLEAFLKSIIGHERHHIRILKDKYLVLL
ncbi:MAG: DinB family protein [Bacteroidota bacterium]